VQASHPRSATAESLAWPQSGSTLIAFSGQEALNQRIPTPPQCQINPLQHDELVPKGDKSKLICLVTSSLSWIELKERSVLQFH
jgi:hypothetical protein